MKKEFALALALFLILPSAIAQSCGLADDSQLIFRASAATNAHAELWDGAGSYPEEICYDALFPDFTGAGPHDCDAANTVLWLSDTTNAHADTTNVYSEEVCFGNLRCTYKGIPGNPAPCGAGEACVATVSALTNAHVSTGCNPATGGYDIKVCCQAFENCGDSIVQVPEQCEQISGCASGTCIGCLCVEGSNAACGITNINPNEVEIGTGRIEVTVSYANFIDEALPTESVFQCGNGGIATSGSFGCTPTSGTDGSCTFECGDYKDLGTASISAKLSDSGTSITCDDSGADVFVFGTKVNLVPLPLPGGTPFSTAEAVVAISTIGSFDYPELDLNGPVLMLAGSYDVYVNVELQNESGGQIDNSYTSAVQSIPTNDSRTFDFREGFGDPAFDPNPAFDFDVKVLALGTYRLMVETFECTACDGSDDDLHGIVYKYFDVTEGGGPGGSADFAVRLDLDPKILANGVNFTTADAVIKNNTGVAGTVALKVTLVDAVTGLPVRDQFDLSPIAIAANTSPPQDLKSFIGANGLPSGNYFLTATVSTLGGSKYSSDAASFTVFAGGLNAVPDLGLFLIPLIAFSVLGILFFKRKG